MYITKTIINSTCDSFYFSNDYSILYCTILYSNYRSLRSRTYYINGYCSIQWISTLESHRNQGHATNLLNYVINYFTNMNIKYFSLDNCSDNFDYTKLNFQYIKKGFPEMLLTIHNA